LLDGSTFVSVIAYEAPCSIMRWRLVDHVWIEEVTVTNHLHEASQAHVAPELDTDFADLFEVKDAVVAVGPRCLPDRFASTGLGRGGAAAIADDAARPRSPGGRSHYQQRVAGQLSVRALALSWAR
jgi:N-terminal domain of (some) glycogen debranching enzymes